MSKTLRLAVLISGSGRTLQNFIERIEQGQMMAEIVVVICNNPKAFGIERAQRCGLETIVLSHRAFPSVESFSHAIFEQCRSSDADLVAMAGFLRLIHIPSDFTGRVMNIHPSLLPAFGGKGFYGAHVHEAVLRSGLEQSGCTVHFVDDQYDHGPVLLQRTVPVLSNDTPETLAERVFEKECEVFPEAINAFARNWFSRD